MPNINAFWFRHDNNARNDEKIAALRAEFGAAGYGVFFMLLEIMHANGTGKIAYNLKALSYQMHESEDFVKEVIDASVELRLISVENNVIWTERMLEEIDGRSEFVKEQSRKGKLSAKARARQKHEVNHGSTAVQPGLNQNPTAGEPGEERRGEDSRGEETNKHVVASADAPEKKAGRKITEDEEYLFSEFERLAECKVLNREKRVKKLREVLKTFDGEMLRKSWAQMSVTPFLMGKNDRNKKFLNIDYALRIEKIEEYYNDYLSTQR